MRTKLADTNNTATKKSLPMAKSCRKESNAVGNNKFLMANRWRYIHR